MKSSSVRSEICRPTGLEIFVAWTSTKISLLTELRKGAQVCCDQRECAGSGVFGFSGHGKLNAADCGSQSRLLTTTLDRARNDHWHYREPVHFLFNSFKSVFNGSVLMTS